MRRKVVCVETPDFFLDEMERIAAEEGDEIWVLSPEGRHRDRPRAILVDPRTEHDRAVRELTRLIGQPDAVLTTQEMFLTQASAIADACTVARTPPAAVAASRDKARMKEIWLAAGVRTPRGIFRNAFGGPDLALDGLEFPLIAKPSQGFASCGVRKVTTRAELDEHLRKIFLVNSTVVAKERLDNTGFLIEEYVDGPEYSIDTVWFDGEPLCDGILTKGNAPGPYYPDRLYYMDPHLPTARADRIREISYRAVRALGVTNGATHTEVRFRDDEPFVLETTNRPGAGGLFYQLFTSASGVDFHRLYYLAATCADSAELRARAGGLTPKAVPDNEYPFWYNLPHRGSGVIRGISGLERLSARDEIDRCLSYKQPGGVLYPEGLEADYFVSVLGVYRPGPTDPPIADHVRRYDDMIEVTF
ncbi:ATP-grasp domain-containing protein [Micromonospora sp. NPDC048835]|uniref:ATP-grasp domain-containing protein n=1 Tax=Micromonospora sp. NPDC048835 TaxID=3155147 RepID=UPI0033CCA243